MADKRLEISEVGIKAEEFLLGAILIQSSDGSKEVINEVRRIVRPDYFSDFGRYQPTRSRIFTAMLNCPEAPHIVNVAKQLIETHKIQPGDTCYLEKLIAGDFNSFEYLSSALAVKECAMQLHPELSKQLISHGTAL
jgi:replicative DNA helicase